MEEDPKDFIMRQEVGWIVRVDDVDGGVSWRGTFYWVREKDGAHLFKDKESAMYAVLELTNSLRKRATVWARFKRPEEPAVVRWARRKRVAS